ncbi:MAG: ribbon-helix-helix protein, CopG family [Nitriliruptoraceae bacterium]
MPDLLIRDIPDAVVAAIDAKAKKLGLSRSEYLRRQMAQSATTGDGAVTAESLRTFCETFGDLGDDEIMRRAWE